MPLTKEYLATLSKEERLQVILKEKIKCMNDPLYTITNYFELTDPDTGLTDLFKMYPYQNRAIRDFELHDYTLTMKTRQTGLTTVSEAYAAWFMATKKKKVVNALAYDKKRSKKFLKGVRDFLDAARKKAPWLIPAYVEGHNGKEEFMLTNGSLISAEANKPDACRGETINLLVIDEVAAITWMEEIWSSAGLTLTRSKGKCIAISTPKGMSGWYFEQYTNAEANGWQIIDAHWSEHPQYKQGMYQWIKDDNHTDGGYVKMFNNEWPDMGHLQNVKKYGQKDAYKYILDGKMRSPWYDYESRKLGKRLTKCELDCSFAGSGGEVLDSEVIRAIMLKAQEYQQINPTLKGIWATYKEMIPYNPLHSYIITCDTMTGDGSDYSSFAVIDLQTMEIAATYKDQLEQKAYAKVINDVGRRYGTALAIIENQNGLTTLHELKDKYSYPRIYYTTLKAKQIERKERKRKLGFWQSEATRKLGGDKLEEWLISGELKVTSMDVVNELHTWVWDKRGRRDHAAGKHDDLIMALTMGLFYINYVLIRRAHSSKLVKDSFEFRREMTVVKNSMGIEDIFDDILDNKDSKNLDHLSKKQIYDRNKKQVAIFSI